MLNQPMQREWWEKPPHCEARGPRPRPWPVSGLSRSSLALGGPLALADAVTQLISSFYVLPSRGTSSPLWRRGAWARSRQLFWTDGRFRAGPCVRGLVRYSACRLERAHAGLSVGTSAGSALTPDADEPEARGEPENAEPGALKKWFECIQGPEKAVKSPSVIFGRFYISAEERLSNCGPNSNKMVTTLTGCTGVHQLRTTPSFHGSFPTERSHFLPRDTAGARVRMCPGEGFTNVTVQALNAQALRTGGFGFCSRNLDMM
ncbi:hypothetical protein AAFF_G00097020 [Aldrovandia affinis]|uniref:Uncharacterized protein n=1 Tax=Aldrovandia affinis TaxID=143900 RepID=A0AAD7RVD4_9TELE|nr:hypothetical protein AAFF_G00097020 [Aldrovandia affinis]